MIIDARDKKKKESSIVFMMKEKSHDLHLLEIGDLMLVMLMLH